MKRFHILFSAALLIASAFSLNAQPKYIFLMFGDGMGQGALTITESYKAYQNGENCQVEHLVFRDFPYCGMMDTQAADRFATGSSEAGTALFCGSKGTAGTIGVDTDFKPVRSIGEILHERGYKVGLMSTDPINHATPAAMYSHNKSRGAFRELTRSIPASGFEFLAGNSFIDFENTEGELNADEYLQNHGYSAYYGVAEFNVRDRSVAKCIMCNERNRTSKSLITAEADVTKDYTLEDYPGDVTPAQYLRCCLDMFGDEQPFLILCEEGNVDHAAHLVFPRAVVNEVLKLEDAVKVALEFYESHKDETLIVVFSDHETGGLSPCAEYKGHTIN